MKRLVSFLLAGALAILVSGCFGPVEQAPLKVCVDVVSLDDSSDGAGELQQKNAMVSLAEKVKELGGSEEIEFEYLPVDTEERAAAITRLRTEVMSGHGPDVFVVNCKTEDFQDALFPLPAAAMRSGRFLPLDEYIAKAEFTDFSDFTPAVMEAGKGEEGQQLIPLTYTFPVTLYCDQDPQPLPAGSTWFQQASSEDPLLSRAATQGDNVLRLFFTDSPLGALADSQTETLCFSEDDLYQWAAAQKEQDRKWMDGKYEDLPANYSMGMCVGFDECDRQIGIQSEFYASCAADSSFSFVPMLNTQGGVTATILSFAGINRNTQRPQDAFRFLDVLLSREYQQASPLWKMLTYGRALPIDGQLAHPDFPISGWKMDEESYQSFSAAREQIKAANFRSALEGELFDLSMIWWNDPEISDEELKSAVEKTYATMLTILAES